jgi:hypothetical protein
MNSKDTLPSYFRNKAATTASSSTGFIEQVEYTIRPENKMADKPT